MLTLLGADVVRLLAVVVVFVRPERLVAVAVVVDASDAWSLVSGGDAGDASWRFFFFCERTGFGVMPPAGALCLVRIDSCFSCLMAGSEALNSAV